jgi:hypothetical protein
MKRFVLLLEKQILRGKDKLITRRKNDKQVNRLSGRTGRLQ